MFPLVNEQILVSLAKTMRVTVQYGVILEYANGVAWRSSPGLRRVLGKLKRGVTPSVEHVYPRVNPLLSHFLDRNSENDSWSHSEMHLNLNDSSFSLTVLVYLVV